jgi:hypothetical protein
MNFINTLIQSTNKPKLIAITCLISLTAPYIISGAKSLLVDAFNRQKEKKALYVGI